MSTDERRALAIILALIMLASTARWLDRPKPLLQDVPSLDLAALEEDSRTAKSSQRRTEKKTPKKAQAVAPTGPIDLNRASQQELEKLPGVGPALARRLIARRDSTGPFRSWEGVDSVPGIGPAMLARLKELAHIDE